MISARSSIGSVKEGGKINRSFLFGKECSKDVQSQGEVKNSEMNTMKN